MHNNKPETISELFEVYLRKRGHRFGEAATTQKRVALNHLVSIVGDIQLTEFDEDAAEAYQYGLARRVKSKHSVNTYVKHIRPMFSFAYEREIMSKDPFSTLKHLKAPIQINEFSREQSKALIGACPNLRWQAIYTAVFDTSMRPTEILNTVWDDVQPDRIKVRPKKDVNWHTWEWSPKNLKPRDVPLSQNLADILMMLQLELPVDQPYPFLSEERYSRLRPRIGMLSERIRTCPEGNWSRMTQQIKRRAGVKKGKFYDGRKTSLTHMSRQPGITPQDLQAIAGHASFETTQIYYLGQNIDAALKIASGAAFTDT